MWNVAPVLQIGSILVRNFLNAQGPLRLAASKFYCLPLWIYYLSLRTEESSDAWP